MTTMGRMSSLVFRKPRQPRRHHALPFHQLESQPWSKKPQGCCALPHIGATSFMEKTTWQAKAESQEK